MEKREYEQRIAELETQMELEQKKFFRTVKLAGLYFWEYDIVNNTCEQSLESADRFGLPVFIKNFDQALFQEDVISEECVEAYRRMFEKIQNGEEFVEADIRLKTKQGKYEWHTIHYNTILNNDDKPVWAIGVASNVTEQKMREESYKRQIEELVEKRIEKERQQKRVLEEALSNAQKATSAKRDFLANMSHDIRTPLNGIMGMLEVLRNHVDEEGLRYLDKANVSSGYLMRLINDVLDMSKIESGKMELDYQWLSSGTFMEHLEAMIRPMAEERGIELSFKLLSAYKRSIYTDASRLEQIMVNLLSNAIKYTSSGGKVEFIVFSELIGDEHLRVRFMVKDNGIGMSEEFVSKAFNSFERESFNSNTESTGLGLSIVDRLTRLMGGNIHLESKCGEGTQIELTFVFRYKVMEPSSDIDIKGDIVNKNILPPHFSNKRALIVEDNEINMEIADIRLRKLGMLTEWAKDGEEAIKMFYSSPEEYYDVIFMDIMMPRKDGFAATREIRQMNRRDAESIPIIAMTANAFLEDVHKSLANGMDYHLSKPFADTAVVHVLSQIFLEKT